ncbi:hypothetical protein ACFVYF_10705 [Streptomyces sp. NPDC058274]|jgi:uncharacterized membrane protein|uniref:hypothetical protein n=1 Tax=Streptomyces sp. NPDC058274 TaxID=3346416 RepID=UPI0036EB22BF
MNNSLRTAAAAAALVTGLVAVGSTTAAAATRPERITSQEQLSANLQKAISAEQDNGAVTDGVVAGLVATSGAYRALC